jgi:hypothetical protein
VKDPVALRAQTRLTLVELSRLAREVEAFEKVTPAPPNAAELRQRAIEAIKASWKAATDDTIRLPEQDRAVFADAAVVWDRDVVTSKELLASAEAVPVAVVQPDGDVVTAAAVVPTQIPLKTKTIEAVSAELVRPNDAAFPAAWDSVFDEATSRYVFDDVVEMRDERGLIQIVPFRAEWAYADGVWQLAYLRVDGQVRVERDIDSVIPVGERPALVYIDRQPQANQVAVGARKAVSAMKGAYLGYRNFQDTSRVFNFQNGATLRGKIVEAGSRGRGILVTIQPFDGDPTVIPLVRFTTADQDYVLEWMRANGETAVTPTIPLP